MQVLVFSQGMNFKIFTAETLSTRSKYNLNLRPLRVSVVERLFNRGGAEDAE